MANFAPSEWKSTCRERPYGRARDITRGRELRTGNVPAQAGITGRKSDLGGFMKARVSMLAVSLALGVVMVQAAPANQAQDPQPKTTQPDSKASNKSDMKA